MKRCCSVQEQANDAIMRDQQRPAVSEFTVQTGYSHVCTYEVHMLERIIEPQVARVGPHKVDSVDRPVVIHAPVDAADVSLSTHDDPWPLCECLLVGTDDTA